MCEHRRVWRVQYERPLFDARIIKNESHGRATVQCDDEVYDDVDDDDDYECVCDVDDNDDVMVTTMMCAMLMMRTMLTPRIMMNVCIAMMMWMMNVCVFMCNYEFFFYCVRAW